MGEDGKCAERYEFAAPQENRRSEMKRNESNVDRIIRGILGAVLLLVALLAVPTGTLHIVLIVVGIIALVTGLVGFCPLYAILGLSTRK